MRNKKWHFIVEKIKEGKFLRPDYLGSNDKISCLERFCTAIALLVHKKTLRGNFSPYTFRMTATSGKSADLDLHRVWVRRKKNYKNCSLGSVVKVQVLEKLWEAALLGDEDYEHVNEVSLSQSVIDNDGVNGDQDSVPHVPEIVPAVSITYCTLITIYCQAWWEYTTGLTLTQEEYTCICLASKSYMCKVLRQILKI